VKKIFFQAIYGQVYIICTSGENLANKVD